MTLAFKKHLDRSWLCSPLYLLCSTLFNLNFINDVQPSTLSIWISECLWNSENFTDSQTLTNLECRLDILLLVSLSLRSSVSAGLLLVPSASLSHKRWNTRSGKFNLVYDILEAVFSEFHAIGSTFNCTAQEVRYSWEREARGEC